MEKIFLLVLIVASCKQEPIQKIPSNGFISGTNSEIKIGSQEAVEVFKKLDDAWAQLDYELIKSFIADEASLSFHDGYVAKTPQEFVDKIKLEVARVEAEGNTYDWTTNYAFALAATDDGSEETDVDTGDWVNAQFTSKNTNPESEIDSEIFYEYYHIVDKKVVSWNSFRKIINK
jgi:hypothetical protein